MILRSWFVRSDFLIVAIMAIVAIWSVLGNASPVAAFEGDTRGNAIEVRKDRRETARSEPVIRHLPARQSSQSTTDDSKFNSGGRSTNRQAIVDPRAKWARSILRTICTLDGNYGASFGQCAAPAPAAPAPAAPAPAPQTQTQVVSEPVTITITSSDLLELIPNSPEILTDRGPWGLKNAHTNFYASHHEPQTVTQTMFDQEVTITATPVEYRWDYGDGETLVTEQPGYPVGVFNTETGTSHQYQQTGSYTVTLTTVFEGTYQVDGGEVQEVSSTVTQQADPVDIRIYRAVTRNVDQTCLDNPEAWGCDMPEN